MGFIFEGKGNGAARLDLDGLGLGVDLVSGRGSRLRDNDAFARLQAVNTDFAIFVGDKNPVAISDHGAVRIGDFELSIRQGHAGVGRAHLTDEQIPVRHVFKADSDDTLLPVVCQVDGLGGLDDAVPLRRIHLLHDVRSWLQARPDGHAVGAGHLLADHRAAGTGGAAQVAELEGGPTQGFTGDTVIFLHHNGVEGHILEGHRPVPAAGDVELLGGGFFDGEARGGFQLRHLVPAVPQALQHDLAAGVGEVGPQVVELAGVGAIAAVPDLKFGPLDGAAGDAVYLLDSQGGLFVVLEVDGVVPVGIEGDHLAGGIQQIGGGYRFLRDLINSGQQIFQGGRAVCPGLDFIHAVAVRRLDGEHGPRHGCAGVGIPLHHRQVGADVVL